MHSLSELVDVLRGRRVVVLSGAGVSTDLGIPDYRGPNARRVRRPLQYDDFVRDPATRVRYWARSSVGWPRVAHAEPNAAHRALAELEHASTVVGVITQNVDGLHQQAGSRRVVELHGALDDVVCLGCRTRSSRHAMQERLLALNPDWTLTGGTLAPDGDADLTPDVERAFRLPSCHHCDGMLKPDVVFFGENVPKPRVAEAWALFDKAEALLVVGSSLAVYSGYRFVLRAAKENMPLAIVTHGETRGDQHAAVKLDAPLGAVLPALADALR